MGDVLQFHSWGFDLFVPPVPFSQPPEQARFVMLDDLNDVFYDVDYGAASLENETSWTDLGLHNVQDPAIVFPPEQQDALQCISFAVGILVAVERRKHDIIHARSLGRVLIKPLESKYMSWGALRGLKGPELPAEMRAGLLRRVWSKPAANSDDTTGMVQELVTRASTLNRMGTKFHEEGRALNLTLNERFVGAKTIGPPSRWRVENLGQKQMLMSTNRAAVFIEH